jgi:hypothetical protein
VVGLPAEVEDLLSEYGGAAGASRLAFAAAAGHVVVVGANAGTALVFRADAGTAHAPRALRVPRYSSENADDPPVIAAWAAAPSTESDAASDGFLHGSGGGRIGVAALSREGTLRVYDSVDTSGGMGERSSQSPACRELRVASILAASAGVASDDHAQCVAGALIYCPTTAGVGQGPGSLFIFGSQGSAAIVSLSEDQLEARSLCRDATSNRTRAEHSQTSSYGIGTILYSVLRGGGWSDSRRRDPDWMAGCGPFSIVGAGPIAGQQGTAFCARKGGEVEVWDLEHMVWACQLSNIASRILPANAYDLHVVRAAASSEQFIVALITFSVGGQTFVHLIAVDVTEKVQPDTVLVIADLGILVGESNELQMTISSDIIYVHICSTGTLLWTSFVRGLSLEAQAGGQFEVDLDAIFVAGLDISSGLAPHVVPPGGRCAFLESDNVMLVSAGVPPPVSSASISADACGEISVDSRILCPRSLGRRAYVQLLSQEPARQHYVRSSLWPVTKAADWLHPYWIPPSWKRVAGLWTPRLVNIRHPLHCHFLSMLSFRRS